MNEYSFIIRGIEKCQGKLKRIIQMTNRQILNKKWGLRMEGLRIAGVFGLEIFYPLE
jgi:hypothetical protein